jgi:hypothetical protein
MSWIAPAIGLLGSIFSGNQASSAASSASAGESALANTQSQLINTLLQQYGNVFQPLETAAGGQYSQLTQLPIDQVLRYAVSNLLQPYINPAAEQQAREANLTGLGQNLDQLVSKLGPALTPAQLTGLAQNYGETAIQDDAALNANIMAQNTAMNNQQQTQAVNMLMNALGAAGTFSSTGRNLTGQSMTGLGSLINTYANQANQAGSAAGAAYGNIPQIVSSYFNQNPINTGTTNPVTGLSNDIPTTPAENLASPSDTFPTFSPGGNY